MSPNIPNRTRTQEFCNTAEDFFREIREVLVLPSNAITFNQAFRSELPDEARALMRIKINTTHDFKQEIKFKRTDYNGYYEYSIKFPFLDLTKGNREFLLDYQHENRYCILLVTNHDYALYGNHREPATMVIQPNMRNNASGKDNYYIELKGTTIINSTLQKVTERFRVLFFIPRLE